MTDPDSLTGAIAIIGMSGRFPGAQGIPEFWQNLRSGTESIRFFSEEELIAAGCPEDLVRKPEYVKARSLVEHTDLFDAEFFGITPREAAHMDPQHRLFLECAWEALEHAGYDPDRYPGPIGLYAGLYLSTYLLANVVTDRRYLDSLLAFKHPGAFQTYLGNDKDFLTSRVSYKLNLRGPGVTIQTACSTSLVAVCQACQSLLAYQCDMALAGGVRLTFPEKKGYLYEEGGMHSPDGHCRAFDARAQGTVFGNGLGIVVLKRLSEAIADGDHIHAVIKGSALNNDGAVKVSYAAPSIDGQAEVIALAHAIAGVSADTIDYVEAHGTGTPLGDPIEVAALTKAFRQTTDKNGFCRIGAVKTNIGHLDAAAGIAGLIKTALALEHREIPPTLHFEQPNPKIDFQNSPFQVVTELTPWHDRGHPRRAGVSSFGVGGTNAHVVLEEAPACAASVDSPRPSLLLLSARTPAALEKMGRNLANHLKEHPHVSLSDVAFTLQTGRRVFTHRCCVVAKDATEAIAFLDKTEGATAQDRKDVPVIFLFPGQGAQTLRMGEGLYATEPVYRQIVDECSELLQPLLGCDLREILFPAAHQGEEAEILLRQTRITQPALFVTEYALAKLWLSWGVSPRAMIGHSVGEYVAACMAGCLSLADALTLVAERARLVQQLPGGSMLAVRLSEAELLTRLTPALAIAAVNAPNLCVAAGLHEEIEALEQQLTADGIACKQLATSHAFHSPMMEPALAPFREMASRMSMHRAWIPFVSCLTGKWITTDEAASPSYWTSHLRQTVRFAEGFTTLLEAHPDAIFLEVGPGQTLFQSARQQIGKESTATLVSSLGAATDEPRAIARALGKLWMSGAAVDWAAFHAPEKRRRVVLPTYPFDRKRHWVEPVAFLEPKQDEPTPGPSRNGQEAHASITAGLDSQYQAVETGIEAPIAPRRQRILQRLDSILFEMSGVRVEGEAASSTFLELGFDSLFLAQARQSIQNEFGVKFTFRQLLEEVTTPAALAQYLDAQMPPEAFPAPLAERRRSSAQLLSASNGSSHESPALPVHSVPGDALAQIQAQLQFLTEQVVTLQGRAAPRAALPALARAEAAPAAGKLFGPFRPVNKARDSGLTAAQQSALDTFIARYNRYTARSKEFAQKHRSRLADPRSVAGFRRLWKDLIYQIVVERSEESHVWDVDGNRYVDITLGFGVTFFGHSPEFVRKAVAHQLTQGVHLGPQSPLAGETAALLCEMTGMDRVTFCNTGSEAVMAAMRIARTVTGRSKVVYFTGDYHGTFDEVLVRANPAGPESRSLPIAPGIPAQAGENILVLDYGSAETIDIIRRTGAEIAAVVVEPVQSRHPDLVSKEFLRSLREVTRETGSLLVFDEVITGFRVHPGGCQALFEIEADMATYGKVAGGGIPVGILAARGTFLDAIDGGAWQFGDDSAPEADMTFFAGTFVRHPLALAAVRAVLLHLKERGPELQKSLNERTARFVGEVNALFEEEDVPLRLIHFSSLFRFTTLSDFPLLSLFIYQMLLEGIYIRDAAQNCFLSTAHTDDDLDEIKGGILRAIVAMRANGFLPGGGAGSDAIFPLTAAQREIWLACQFGENASRAYNESVTASLRGPLDRARLVCALRTVTARHDALRTVFLPDGSGQRVLPRLEPPVRETDLSLLSQEARGAAIPGLQQREVSTTFDLEHGPLVRFEIVRLTPEEHLLLFTAHHLVCDGWSGSVILNEIRSFYADPAKEMPAPPRFEDYVQRLSDPETTAYWQKKFATIPAPLDLPADFPRPAQRSFRGSRATCMISSDRVEVIRRTSRTHGCTLFATLFAAYQALLFRITGQAEFTIGIPVAGQSLAGLEHLVGHCANLLPIRAKLEPTDRFADRMKAARGQVLEAYEHGEFTFSELLTTLQFPRDPRRPALVSVVFNLDPPPSDLPAGELTISTRHTPREFYQFDLGLNLVEGPNGLRIECDYSTDLFEPSSVTRLLECYVNLLDAAASAPDTLLSALPLLSAEDRKSMLVDWNRTKRAFPRDKTVAQLFEKVVERMPDAVAIHDGSRQVTYRELDDHASALAFRLRQQGVQRGSLVALPAVRSAQFIASIVGILKAGGAYVPVDPKEPKGRSESWSHAIHFRLDDDGVVTGSRPAEDRRPGTAEDPAYVLFTSGSTGTAKGVVVPHRAITRLVRNTDYITIREDDVFAFASNPSFDAATFELWGALLNGGSVVVTALEDLLSPAVLRAHLKEYGITTLFLTTSLFNQLARQAPDLFAGLRNLLFGGEIEDPESVRLVLQHGKPANFVHAYGPTETTTFAVCHRIVELGGDRVPIGRPIANTRAYVLDRQWEPVPVGVPGELYIGGPGLALGYLDAPELTAERFLDTPQGRLYRTGDCVRWRADGTLEYLSRLDQQVKLRGFRIEPGEIEAALRQHSTVSQSAVTLRTEASGNKALIGYVTPRNGRMPDPGELRAHLKARLPEYMIPTALVPLPTLPLNRNGKLDFSALPEPVTPAPAAGGVLPTNATERRVLAIWTALLGRPGISTEDDFFLAGGHSLLAIQLISRIREEFSVDVPIRRLFETPTVQGLARHIDADRVMQEGMRLRCLVPIQRGDERRRPLFLVPGGWGGEIEFLVYAKLGREIDPQLPLFGLRARGSSAEEVPHESVEDMATAYIREIRMHQPEGPYWIAGECVGGVVAYEVARQLRALGEEVALLALLDTERPTRTSLRRFVAEERKQQWHDLWQGHIVQPAREHWAKLSRLPMGARLRYILQRMVRGTSQPVIGPELRERKILADYPRKLMAYQPQPYGGKITLIVDEESHQAHGHLGWSPAEDGELELHVVPGNHLTYIREHAAASAALIRKLLRDAESQQRCRSQSSERNGGRHCSSVSPRPLANGLSRFADVRSNRSAE